MRICIARDITVYLYTYIESPPSRILHRAMHPSALLPFFPPSSGFLSLSLVTFLFHPFRDGGGDQVEATFLTRAGCIFPRALAGYPQPLFLSLSLSLFLLPLLSYIPRPPPPLATTPVLLFPFFQFASAPRKISIFICFFAGLFTRFLLRAELRRKRKEKMDEACAFHGSSEPSFRFLIPRAPARRVHHQSRGSPGTANVQETD